MPAGTAFKICAPIVLLWFTFQTVVKIAYNLSVFTLFIKQGDILREQFFIALFCVYIQRVYDLKIQIMYNKLLLFVKSNIEYN